MSQGKPTGGSGRGAAEEDPAEIRRALLDLLKSEAEFPIRVEGAQTLPYSARVTHLDGEQGLLHLKLIRPLPHELTAGAAFGMLFSLEEQRFEAQTVFHGREDYLLYRFTIPTRLVTSDRRRHKRYPFRPREKAYVVAQDGGVPGHGLSGPLVNLSLGGLAFRVDRVLRLDDHLRVTPGLGFFERGKPLPMIKVRDLPNLPSLDVRGTLANAYERGGEIIACIQFGELGEAELREITEVLTFRDRLQRAPAGAGGEVPRDSSPRSPVETKGPAARVAPAGSQTPDALKRLGRRCTRLVLAMAPGHERDQVRLLLFGAGFLRLETADTLDQAFADLKADKRAAHPLLVFEPQAGEGLPLVAIRTLQQQLGEMLDLPVALITRAGPLPETEDPLIRPMPWPTAEDPAWPPLLDELAGLS